MINEHDCDIIRKKDGSRVLKRKTVLFIALLLAAVSAAVVGFSMSLPKGEAEPIQRGFCGKWTDNEGDYSLEITKDGLVRTDNTEFFDIYSMVPTVSFREITENMGVFCVHYPDVTVEFACELDEEILVITPPVYYSGALVLKREGSSADTDAYLKEHFPHLANNG